MRRPAGIPETIEVVTAAEHPDLWESVRVGRAFDAVWPEYNHHGNDTATYFGALVPRFAAFQALLLEAGSTRPLARARTIPLRWDGTLDDLPAGIDAAGLRAVGPQRPSALCALAAEVLPGHQGTGLSALVLRVMAALARSAGFSSLVAPVRPSHKDRHPEVPIAEYARWTRADGLPADPWLRTHARLGGEILRAEPRSLRIAAPVPDWERWTGVRFPERGPFVFPRALAPATVADGAAEYYEPNVWVRHRVDPGPA